MKLKKPKLFKIETDVWLICPVVIMWKKERIGPFTASLMNLVRLLPPMATGEATYPLKQK